MTYRDAAPTPSDEERIEELKAALKRDVRDVGVLADLARLELKVGDLEAAMKFFRALLLMDLRGCALTKADVFYNLGVVEERRGEPAHAVKMLERALDADASHAEARAMLNRLRDDSDIERAARHHRERLEKEETAAERKARRDAESNEKAQRSWRKENRADGLAGWLGQWLSYVAAVVALIVPVIMPAILFHDRELPFAAIAAAVVVAMVGMFAAVIYTPQLVAPFRLAAIRRRGGGKLDIANYLEQLSDTWRDAHIEVRIELSKHIDPAKRYAIPDAVMDWVPDLASVAWDDATLVITGKDVTTTFMGFGKYATSYPSNREIHDSFARIARVFPKLRATYAIERIGVEIKGEKKN